MGKERKLVKVGGSVVRRRVRNDVEAERYT